MPSPGSFPAKIAGSVWAEAVSGAARPASRATLARRWIRFIVSLLEMVDLSEPGRLPTGERCLPAGKLNKKPCLDNAIRARQDGDTGERQKQPHAGADGFGVSTQ